MSLTNYTAFRADMPSGTIKRKGVWPYSEAFFCVRCTEVYGRLYQPDTLWITRTGFCPQCEVAQGLAYGSHVRGSLWPYFWDLTEVVFSDDFLQQELLLHVAAVERGELLWD